MRPDLQQKIDSFFRPPEQFDRQAGNHSILYLLRRDISTCLGTEPNSGGRLPTQAFFPITLAVLTGIDLLAKFRLGDAGKVAIGLESM